MQPVSVSSDSNIDASEHGKGLLTMMAVYHSSFPVLARASWGFWGSYLAIISRCILAVFWFAIQTMNGANTVRVMLGAIWPSYLRLPNHIPESQGIDTKTMVAFFLFWLAQIPFLMMSPQKVRFLFLAKSIIVPIAWIAILIWAFVSTSGGDIFDQKTTLHGSAYSWAWLANWTAVIGNYATLSVNQVSFKGMTHGVSERRHLLMTIMLG